MKYIHTISHKLMVKVEEELQKQCRKNEPLDRVDVWKVAHQKKNGGYINEEARQTVGKFISSIFLLISIILSTT